MAKKKRIDGVIEAVHYQPDGQVSWVRAFLRRGATFSDRTLLSRQELVNQLKVGKHFVIGTPIEFQASTFHVSSPVELISANDRELLVGQSVAGTSGPLNSDNLVGAPVL